MRIQAFLIFCLAIFLSNCAVMNKSTSLPVGDLNLGINIINKLPATLPGNATPIPGSNYIVVLPDSAATLLVPVPFLGEAVVGALHKHSTEAFKDKFNDADPYKFAFDSIKQTSLYRDVPASYKLYPYVIVQDSVDDQFRVSLIYQLETKGWIGRYIYHLPTTYPRSEFKNTPPAEIKSLQSELALAAKTLTDLVLRDNEGRLNSSGKKATVGSLYFVSNSIVGLVSPSVLAYPAIDILEEGKDYVILRSGGDVKGDAQSGVLFGVHYFYRNQLHTFKADQK